jgi:hypothetical protein
VRISLASSLCVAGRGPLLSMSSHCTRRSRGDPAASWLSQGRGATMTRRTFSPTDLQPLQASPPRGAVAQRIPWMPPAPSACGSNNPGGCRRRCATTVGDARVLNGLDPLSPFLKGDADREN